MDLVVSKRRCAICPVVFPLLIFLLSWLPTLVFGQAERKGCSPLRITIFAQLGFSYHDKKAFRFVTARKSDLCKMAVHNGGWGVLYVIDCAGLPLVYLWQMVGSPVATSRVYWSFKICLTSLAHV